MNKRYALILVSLLINSGLASLDAPPASADPAGPAPTNRVGLIEDASADFALRLRLTQNAQRTLDVIMSEYTSDAEIGLPLLLALRDAANRGVKVRLLSGYFSSVFAHSTKDIRRILDDRSLKQPPELILDGEWFHSPIRNPDATMWTSFDEKIMIADGDKAVLGGRNVGGEYLHWQDCSIYLEGPVVPEIQNRSFDPIWKLARQLYVVGQKNSGLGTSRAYGAFHMTQALSNGMAEAERIQNAPEYTPARIDVVPTELIARMMAQPGRHLPAPTADPVLETFLRLAQHSKRAYFYSLYPAGDRRMAEGLGQAVRNGSKVALITNSYESSKKLSAIPLPYEGGITTMEALASVGVTVYQWVPTAELDFMHQKLAIVDDVVIFGSHNFNYSSTHGYDQLDLVIHDKALADLLASRFEEQAATHTRVATAAFLGWQRRHQLVGVEISKLLLGLY